MPVSVFPRLRLFHLLFILSFLVPLGGKAWAQGEAGRICEVKPAMRCLDKAKLEGTTLKVPIDAAAVQRDGFLICDSSFNYTTAPDIVLIMDNTGSMDSETTIDGIPRWCENPAIEKEDPGCISGDPHRQRGPALQAFLDSAVVKGGKGINVGVVTFAQQAEAKSEKLLPLTDATLASIKGSIVMEARGSTNYTAAFRAAMELLTTSHKPKSEQFVIFVSDGRPNFPTQPDGDPHGYATFWDSLPTVHCIFLGDNKDNYKDMQDIASHTKGDFLHISDVSVLASYLTNDLAKKLFRRASPTLTTVRNLTAPVTFQIEADKHIPMADSGAYTLLMPGPLELVKGVNEMVFKTEYGYGGTTQDVHFKIERSATGPYFTGLEQSCRAYPKLNLYGNGTEALNVAGGYFSIADSAARYVLTTAAQLDSFDIIIKTQSTVTSQQDLESVHNSAANKKDSTWSGSKVFQHQTLQKAQGDGKIQIEHGEYVVVSYKNPYIREDSVTARVKMKYGPEFDKAEYRDTDNNGRIETVTIHYQEALKAVPDKLGFKIVDAAGVSAERTATLTAGEIAFPSNGPDSFDRTRLVVTLKNPFPFGMTSVVNSDSSGRTYRQLDIPMVDGAFKVDDSVPPVIVNASVATDKSTGVPKVTVTYSEPVNLADPFLEPLIFKRDTVVFSSKDLPIDHITKLDARKFEFYVKKEASFKPVGGDSVSINNNGETRDVAGIAPKALVYTAMGGPAPSQSVSGFYVTFSNGSNSRAAGASESPDKGVIFFPVDAKGYPVPGTESWKCEKCTAQQEGVFTGSIITVITKQPVRYDFTIYTNLGQVVSHGEGKVAESDLKLLDKVEDPNKDPNQTKYVQRIVWTGRTDAGNFVGSGAYVLKAVFHYDLNLKTGGRPSVGTQITKFGFLRNCCNAFNSKWYY